MTAYVYEIAVNAYSNRGWSQFFTYRSKEPFGDTHPSYDEAIIDLALEHDLIDEEDVGSITYTRRLDKEDASGPMGIGAHDCGHEQEEE